MRLRNAAIFIVPIPFDFRLAELSPGRP